MSSSLSSRHFYPSFPLSLNKVFWKAGSMQDVHNFLAFLLVSLTQCTLLNGIFSYTIKILKYVEREC